MRLGAAVRVLFALWNLVAGAASGWRCRVPLQGAASLESAHGFLGCGYLGSLLAHLFSIVNVSIYIGRGCDIMDFGHPNTTWGIRISGLSILYC